MTKYLNGPPEFQENDISVTKFLEAEDGIAVTKYLGQRSNDIVVTMFQNLDTTVTKFLGDYDITIIEFLDTVLPKYLEDNDISVTKFLDRSIGQFLSANDISVTKFLDETNSLEDNEISITKFLTDTSVSNFPILPRRYSDNSKPTALTPRKEPTRRDNSEYGGSWDDDLLYRGGEHLRSDSPESLHKHFEHARTVYPMHHENPHAYRREHPRTVYPDGYEYEHHARAKTVYPHDYSYHMNSSQYDLMPYAETRRHVEPPYKSKKKHKMSQAEKEAKEAIKREHEAARKLEEEH